MKNRFFMCNCKVPMRLQIFAEGDGAGAGEGGNGGGSGTGGEGEPRAGTEPMSFDDFLKGEGNQAEFDRRVQKAIETAVSNAQQKWQALADDKLSEAEKLAKMNKELSDREAAITRKELMAEAKNTLAEKKLPVSLAEVLNYTDADTCSKSISAVEKAFQEAVEAAVNERLKGGTPPKKAPQENVTKETYAKMGYTERLKLKTENPELYKQLAGK